MMGTLPPTPHLNGVDQPIPPRCGPTTLVTVSTPLPSALDAFIEVCNTELGALSGKDHRTECVIEAKELVSAVMVSDGRVTSTEITAWLSEIGTQLDPPVMVSPDRLRSSDLLPTSDAWLSHPSTLFDLLASADGQRGTRRAVAYYTAAVELAHATAAIDLVPSPDEVAAIDRFRTMLLGEFDRRGLPRPGQPASASSTPSTPSPAADEPELPPERPADEILADLDALVGLDEVKSEVRRLTSYLRIQNLRAEIDLPVIDTSRHLIFVGNPGTGKTTIARLLSELYRSLGIVERGHLVETDRSQLVAGYVGQTATTTHAVLTSALGGTVLIDEAYSLARGGDNDFGREAIDTLVKFMEDHRDNLAVIVAGYPTEMTALIETNPGLKSRFARTVEFPDYTTDELIAIFELIAGSHEYVLSAAARDRLGEVIAAEPRGRGFGNARFVRNVFEQAISLQAVRLTTVASPTRSELTTLEADDIASV